MTVRKENNQYRFEGKTLRVEYCNRHCSNCYFTDECLEETGKADKFEALHKLKPCYIKPECHYVEYFEDRLK